VSMQRYSAIKPNMLPQPNVDFGYLTAKALVEC